MKVIVSLAIVAAFFAGASLRAQTTAQNWTKTDCDGNTHSLFSELDSGNVVVMDFAMTYLDYPGTSSPCVPCSTATAMLTKLDAEYALSHPGKLRHYAMAYTNVYSCDDLSAWESNLGFSMTTMAQCSSDVKFYGGMGMPTIVVAGGPNHKVLYKKQGFAKGDTVAIKKAIEAGFTASAGVAQNPIGRSNVWIADESGNKSLELDLTHGETLTIEILDILGKKCATLATDVPFSEGRRSLVLPIDRLGHGTFIARVQRRFGNVVSVPFTIVN